MNIIHYKPAHSNIHEFEERNKSWQFSVFTDNNNGELSKIVRFYYWEPRFDDDFWELPSQWYVNGVCDIPKCINLDHAVYPTSVMNDEAIYFVSHYLPKLQKLQVFI